MDDDYYYYDAPVDDDDDYYYDRDGEEEDGVKESGYGAPPSPSKGYDEPPPSSGYGTPATQDDEPPSYKDASVAATPAATTYG